MIESKLAHIFLSMFTEKHNKLFFRLVVQLKRKSLLMLYFQQVIENKLAHIFFSGTVMSKCNKCEYEVSKKNNLREHIRKYHE